MARATRSSNKADEKPKESGTAPASKSPSGKAVGRKRKRISNGEADDQPAIKQARNGDDEDSVKLDDGDAVQDADMAESEPLGVGDVPLDPRDAERILEILERIDTQGLLDREFPLPPEAIPSDPQTSSSPRSYSFRALLKDASRYPARVLFAAVKPLVPIFSHPRSRTSGPAAQQQKFCTLARQLLQQATFNTNPIIAKLETVIPTPNDLDNPSSSELPSTRRYALKQKLPTGEWWTSLNASALDPAELRDLPTGHAELVAILPTPEESTESIPTLAHYTRTPISALSRRSQSKLPAGRRISSGAFLDYGPYSSFAPTFDQEGAEVGRVALGEVLWWEERKRKLEVELSTAPRGRRGKLPALPPDGTDDIEMDEIQEIQGPSTSTDDERESPLVSGIADAQAGSLANGEVETDKDPTDLLDGMMSADQIASIKATLDDLALEDAVQEMLARTSRALHQLEELQSARLAKPDGGTSTVDPGSEEFTLAENINDSLALLASLRPQTEAAHSLAPPSHILRKLHRTLPVAPAPGWYGTLPDAHSKALQDDTTVHVKSGTIVPTPAPPAPAAPATPAPAKPAATPTAAYTPYTAYGTYAAGTYRPGATTPYNYPAAASSYYNYGQAGQTNQMSPEAYAAWLAVAAMGAGASTQGVQQWASATTTPGRAVANTVAPAKTYAPWQGANVGYTPTIARTNGPGQGA